MARPLLPTGVLLSLWLTTAPAHAEFIGDFELGPPGCQAQGQCTLTYDFKYVDPNGVGWQAAAQNQTDGASIPPWAQPFIGQPFDEKYIRAAVIHDHYCDRHVRTWRATHRVFYEALLELGVASANAKLMYYAVYLGGPKWINLIPGNSCGVNCVFEVKITRDGAAETMEFELSSSADAAAEFDATSMDDEGVIIFRSESYDAPGFVEELQDVERILAAKGDEIDLDFLERRAKEKRPNDFFYANESQIEVDRGFSFR
jgi:Protein of unknown function (DUF1353)